MSTTGCKCKERSDRTNSKYILCRYRIVT